MKKATIISLLTLLALVLSLLFETIPIKANVYVENSWLSKTSMNIARSDLGVATVNGKIYAIGGIKVPSLLDVNAPSPLPVFSNPQLTGANEEYDPSTNSWSFKVEMPIPKANFAIAAFQNKIYCIGGTTDSVVVSLTGVYDLTKDSWENKAPMPTSEEGMQANIVNGKIYIIGGGTNYVYNPTADNWTTITPAPITQNGSVCSCVFDNKIFVLGSPCIQIYDPDKDRWTTGAQIPVSMTQPVAAATSGIDALARIYVLDENIVGAYDPQTNFWIAGAELPTVLTKPSQDVGRTISNLEDYGVTVSKEYANSRFYPEDISELTINQQYIPFGYGTVSPEISVTSPINASYYSSEVMINFTVNKPFNWTCYSLDGKENITTKSSTTLTGLPSGLHTLILYANDSFGNVGNQTVTFTISKPEMPPNDTYVIVSEVSAVVVVVVIALLVYFKKRKH